MKKYTPGWRNRSHEMMDFEARQRRVQFLKFALPAAVVALLAVMFIWPKVAAWREAARFPAPLSDFAQRLKQNPDLKNKVLKPVLHALDPAGRAIEIQADVARQVSLNVVLFENPKGTFCLENGSWVTFEAATGRYKRREDVLDLEGAVRIRTQDGYDVTTHSAHILLREGRGFGQDAVAGTGPTGEALSAEGFELRTGDKNLRLTGRTRISYPTSQ